MKPLKKTPPSEVLETLFSGEQATERDISSVTDYGENVNITLAEVSTAQLGNE
jgi:hypothetical protein